MTEVTPFGVLLRGLRTVADLTRAQLAAATGVSVRAISDLERGISRGPRVRTVEALADGLAATDDDRAALLAAARDGGEVAPAGGLPLPRQVVDFTGRGEELTRVAEWLAAGPPAPVVVVSGPAGVGKTSFAVRVAQRWPVEDRLFVDLRGLDARPMAPAAVLARLIRALGPDVRVVPRDLDQAVALWHGLLAGRRGLIVLDNAISHDQVLPVLPPHGPTAVLVTSRRRLGGLGHVRRLHLKPLPADDSVALLRGIVDRAGASPDALRHIAELCVHIPLALRIAGNRLASRPAWSPDDLIARLAGQERRLDNLAAGDLQVEAAFSLSYQQLSAPAQRVFRRLALVPGPSTGAELASVLAGEPLRPTEEALGDLVDLGLLQQRADGRLEFHDLLRLYAGAELERTETAAERAATARRRDSWLLDTAIVAGRFFEPEHSSEPGVTTVVALTDAAQAGAWLRREAENWLPALRAAAAAGDDQRVIDVAESLHWFSDTWDSGTVWEEVFTLSAGSAERLGDDRLQAIHQGYLTWVHTLLLQQPETALAHARRALEAAVRSGDQRQQAWAGYYMSWVLYQLREWDESIGYARTAVAEFRAAGDREGLPNGLLQWARATQSAGRDEDTIPILREVIEAVTDPGTAPLRHIALSAELTARDLLADVEISAGRWPAARLELLEALAVLDRTGMPPIRRLITLSRLALVHAEIGDLAAARADLILVRRIQVEGTWPAGQLAAVDERVARAESILAADEAGNAGRPPGPGGA
ncbi:helix-turn-helix domain-containing protein [Paractinoplanes maris]|uniref:helix-turn-helix domain-containing protein n=1 Tax=Paractinoplanes maris TaxID=1734446 RepID=UPI002020E9DB|nr:helix-turn-helix domain-containing protein [Actinoplanes maris]